MINAEFYLKSDVLTGFCIKGHAGFADFGLDIVCASVTSAVELTANAITEILKIPAVVGVLENEVRLILPNGDFPDAVNFLKALRLHLELLSQDYRENIRLTDLEL